MMNLYIDESDCDILTQAGREPAICELTCENCGDGMRFDQKQCQTCGELNRRYTDTEFSPRIRRSTRTADR